MNEDNVQLKVHVSRDINRRLKQYVTQRYPDLLRGPLSIIVEEALSEYLESKTHTHTQPDFSNSTTAKKEKVVETKTIQPINYSVSNSKYKMLIDTIKRYSNSNNQITSGLAKKAIKETIGKDERTVNKYLKILQEEDILYGDSQLGVYDIQSWVLGDYNENWKRQKEEIEMKVDKI